MAGIESPTTGNGVEVDAGFRAIRTSIRPHEVLGWQSLGVNSGAMTGLAINTTAFSFRNLSANLIIVRRVGIGFVATTGFTAAQQIAFGMVAARGFTTSDSAQTAIAINGSNGKHRTSLATPNSLDCRISNVGPITTGVRTKDANYLSQAVGWASAAASGVIIPTSVNNLFGHDPEDYPLVLAQNEGFLIDNITAMGAGGVGTLFVNFEFAEALSF